MKIIGVVKDFQYGKLDNKIGPFIFEQATTGFDYLNVKINSSDWKRTMDRLSNLWHGFDPVHPLDATFYSDQIAQAYNEYSVMIRIIGFLSFLAISIASLGLFGMVVYITETRIREMSIRKVLGASERNLVYIMSRGFLLLLFVAAVIALPLTYLFFDRFVLANYTSHAPITFIDLTSGDMIVFAIALVMVGAQTFKIARSNPASVLKAE